MPKSLKGEAGYVHGWFHSLLAFDPFSSFSFNQPFHACSLPLLRLRVPDMPLRFAVEMLLIVLSSQTWRKRTHHVVNFEQIGVTPTVTTNSPTFFCGNMCCRENVFVLLNTVKLMLCIGFIRKKRDARLTTRSNLVCIQSKKQQPQCVSLPLKVTPFVVVVGSNIHYLNGHSTKYDMCIGRLYFNQLQYI